MMNDGTNLRLLEAFKLDGMEIRNRMVMAPMVVSYGTNEGYVSEQTKAYYEERARGGVGLIIVEATSVDLSHNKCWPGQLSIDGDKFIPGMKKLVQAIHKYGTKVALQLHHGGSAARQDLVPLTPVAPSTVPYKDAYLGYEERKERAQELTLTGIKEIVDCFADAAGRAEKAGFDGIEISAGHGYLISQFLSAAHNKRKDAYGGELRNRARFLTEIIAAIREVVGSDYPLWCRLTAEEPGLEGGITFEETKELVGILEEGDLAAISISGVPPIRTFYDPPGYFTVYAGEIKKFSRLPVMVAGSIDVDLGERILRNNMADLVVMGRALLADPEVPKKLYEKREDDIKPCLRCSCCRDCIAYLGVGVKCTVNAQLGREMEFDIRATKKPIRVIIIGGGVAGMEASKILSQRGHEVTLFEKEPSLGGQLLLAAIPPNKDRIEKYRNYLMRENRKIGVQTIMNTTVTVDFVKEINPDVVVIATGSTSVIPNIPGIKGNNVVPFEDVITGRAKTGSNIVIIGGGVTGCETAHYLVETGKRVTIVEMLDHLLEGSWPSTMAAALINTLAKSKIVIKTSTRVDEVTEDGVVTTDKKGNRQFIKADTVIPAIGRIANTELYEGLKKEGFQVHLIGDAIQPGKINEAVATAFSNALVI